MITKNCENCYRDKTDLCVKYCINYSSHQFSCDFCKYKLNDNKRFCEMDDGDDGMSCCGDKFELNEAL